MKITIFDRPNSRDVQHRLLQAMQTAASEMGVTVSNYGGTIEFGGAEMVLKFKVRATSGAAREADAQRQNLYLGSVGLSGTYGKQFVHDDQVWSIVECSLKSRKYPVIAVTQYGRRRKFAANYVKTLLEREHRLLAGASKAKTASKAKANG